MSVYLVSGAKNTTRDFKIKEMLTEILGTEYEKTVDFKIIDLEDGKKNISIEQIRLIEDFTLSKPIEKNFKVILIKNADRLSIEAQNAMLKTLEEPPTFLKFILEAGRAKNLLKTIISRCILIELGSEELVSLETSQSSAYVDDFIKLLNKDNGARFDWAIESKDLFKEGDNIIDCFNSWESFVRDLLIFSEVDKSFLKNKYKVNDIESISLRFEDKVLIEKMMLRILRAKSAASANVNKSLILENFLVALPHLNA